jgi:hypothetical protein
MKWSKTFEAHKKWADMVTNNIKELEERKTITKWNWLVLQITVSVFFLILIWKW